MKKYILLVLLLFCIPVAFAEDDNSGWIVSSISGRLDSIGDGIRDHFTGLVDELPQRFYDFFEAMVNAPLTPLLNAIKHFLETPPVISIFGSIWSIITYTISLFYGLILAYAGLLLMISGYDYTKRADAKETIKNAVIMIVLIQLSFLLYEVILAVSSGLSSFILSKINPDFFRITFDSSFGLSIVCLLIYFLILFFTLLWLIMNYIIVSCGVVFFPIGILLSYINATNDYGRAIIGFLMTACFTKTVVVVILLVVSMLSELPPINMFKSVFVIAGFLMVNLAMFILYFLPIIKSGVKTTNRVLAMPVVREARRVITKGV